MISAIIPAFNEGRTIAEVVKTLVQHELVDEIIVVDDGSTDNTSNIARQFGASVIILPKNVGKAEAMQIGVSKAKGNILFFLDGDITGLSKEIINTLIAPVLDESYDMFVAVRGRNIFILNRIIHFFPILGGERVLTRNLWESVPTKYKTKFQIEIALNYFAKRNNRKMSFTLIPELHHIIKERKYGFIQGIQGRLRLYHSVITISLKLYIFRYISSFFEKSQSKSANALLK